MTSIEKKTVRYLSRLARIACTPAEEEALFEDLKKILSYFELLNEVPTDDVAPCNYVNQMLQKAPLREDIPNNTLSQKEFLAGAPQHTAQMVRVPQVLKNE